MVCGLVILVAGGIQLLRVSDGAATATASDLAIGDSATAGDMRVTVEAAEESDGTMRVRVRIAGVDDPQGRDSFRLVVPGAALVALPPQQSGPGSCATMAVDGQQCMLVFATADVEGSARVLLLRRGEDQRRWNLR